MSFPLYPAHLKNADWQKQKGAFAKMFKGETGIGEAMNKAVAAYDKLDLAKISPKPTYKSAEDLAKAIADSKAELAKTEAVRKELYALRDLAKKVGAEFKKNKLIPSSTTAHLEKIARDADQLGVAIKSYDPSKDFAAAKEMMEKMARMAAEAVGKVVKTGIPKIRGEVAKAKPGDYPDPLLQAVRAFAAAVPKVPALKPVAGEWTTMSSKTDFKDAPAVKKHLEDLEALMKKTEKLVA